MVNIYLMIAELLICLIVMIILYKVFKLEGLYGYTIMASIISILMSFKMISIYNFDVNLGIIPFGTIFIASNIILQKYGPDEIKKLTLTVVSMIAISVLFLYLSSNLNSSNINLFTNKSYDNIFMDSIMIIFANVVTIFYCLLLNGKLYYYLKTLKNKIWISNLFSSIIINFIACISFPVISYILTKEPREVLGIIIIRYIICLIVSIFGTINIYIANLIKEK